jgi:V/A-type H+-transporting ATPase subunit D
MAKLRLSKAALAKERQQLKLYGRLLPSLDLKRRQLTVESEKARRACREAQSAAQQYENDVGQKLPMIANPNIDLRGLVQLQDVELGTENIVGVKLPVLTRVDYEVAEYSFISTPAWVDELVTRLQEIIELRLKARLAAKRVQILEYAVRRVTQRVNLFDRILIPNARRNIKKIQVFLGDLERDAVIRSKIAKRKGLLGRAGWLESAAAE